MKALVYHGPGKKQLEEVPKPKLIAVTDAVVRMTKTTICGTDLHILKGTCPRLRPVEYWAMKALVSLMKPVPVSLVFAKATAF